MENESELGSLQSSAPPQTFVSELFKKAPLLTGVIEKQVDEFLSIQTSEGYFDYFSHPNDDASLPELTEYGSKKSVTELWLTKCAECESLGCPVRFDYWRQTKKGLRHFSAIINQLDNPTSEALRFTYLILDLSDLESDGERLLKNTLALKATVLSQSEKISQADMALIKSEERFRATFESAAVGIAMVDVSGKFFMVNEKLCEIVGYSREEFSNLTFQDITHPDDLEEDIKLAGQLLAGKISSYSLEKRYRKKDGTYFWIRLTGSAVRDSHGAVKYCVAVIQDINEKWVLQKFLSEKEDRLQMVLKASKISMWDWDPVHDSTLSLVHGLEVFGANIKTFEELEALIVPEDREALAEKMQNTLVNSVPLSAQFRIRRRDTGELRYLECYANYFEYDNGKISRLGGITYDITQRVQAEETLVETARQFKRLAETLPNLIWKASPKGEISYFNRPWFEFTGADEANSLGWKWLDYVHPDDRENVENLWQATLAQKNIFHAQFRIKNRGGEYRWFIGRASPHINSSGAVVKWFGSLTDIEEQKELQGAIEEALTLRDEFLSIAGHELRSPLTSLKMHLQMLLDRISPENQGNRVDGTLQALGQMSLRQTNHLIRLSDNLLDLSRIKSGQMHVQLEESEIVETTQEVLLTFEERFRRENSKLTVKFSNPQKVRLDKSRYGQILENILSNALKYAPGKAVKVSVLSDNDFCIIKISDQGKGIAKKFQKTIFEPFSGQRILSRTSGLGLGLYICKNLMLAHNGDIELESDKGKGTTVTLKFPLAP